MVTLHSLNPIEPHDAQNDAQNDANDAKNDANDAKNEANDAKNESQKTLEEQAVELIRDNNSISKIEMSKKQKVKIYYRENVKQSKVIARVGSKNGEHWEIVKTKTINLYMLAREIWRTISRY